MLVFHHFIRIAKEAAGDRNEAQPPDLKRIWTLLQVQPVELWGNDVFLRIFLKLEDAADEDMENQLAQFADYFETHIPEHWRGDQERLYCIFDQAQVLSSGPTALLGAFTSRHNAEPRPVPTPLLREADESFGEWCYLLSGTSVNEDFVELLTARASSLPKGRECITVLGTGGFDTPEEHADYIRRFVPPHLVDTLFLQLFTFRACFWTRGRYCYFFFLCRRLTYFLGDYSPLR